MFTLTRQEKVFLLVLSLVVLTGSSMNYIFKRFPPLKNKINFLETAPFPGRININTASLDELVKIPYVGEKRAAQILDYRVQKGSFKTIEQIQEIYGIGPKTFRKMAPYIWVPP